MHPPRVPFGLITRRILRVIQSYAAMACVVDQEELLQQGWVIALEAVQTYDPSRELRSRKPPSLGGYLWRALIFGLKEYLWSQGSPVSGSRDCLRGTSYAPLDELTMMPREEEHTPIEERLDQGRRDHEVQMIVRQLVDEDPSLALGFAPFLEDERPQVIAERAGVSRQDVYRAEVRVRRAVKRMEFAWQE